MRAAREQKGITLAQAAADTRIMQRYIVALEDGNYQALPGDVYVRGFLRNYAGYLGLPIDEIVELYRHDRGRSEPITIVSTTSTPRVRTFIAPSVIGVFLVVLFLSGISYVVLSATNRIGESAAVPTADLIPTYAPPPSPLPTFTPLPTDAALAVGAAPTVAIAGVGVVPTTMPEPSPTQIAPIVAEVRIDGGDNPGSWLEIKTDGKSVFRRVLPAGNSLQYTAQRSFSVRAGNASVVLVTVNGREQRLGTVNGEVVTYNWPP